MQGGDDERRRRSEHQGGSEKDEDVSDMCRSAVTPRP
jgi:hypothetical protein